LIIFCRKMGQGEWSRMGHNFYEFLPEIPRNPRFANWPELGKILTEGVLRDRGQRDQKVEEAVERHGYTQREVADFLGLHFTSVSRIMNQRSKMQRK